MSIDHIQLSQKERDQLITLKRRTGIQNWNTICRWAFCISLSDGMRVAQDTTVKSDSTVEMSWKTFGGQYDDVYLALLKQRCHSDGFDPCDEKVLMRQFRLHLNRGLTYLTGDKRLQSIGDLVTRAMAA